MKVEDSVPLVTGSNRGIGRAVVTALMDRGVRKLYVGVRQLASAAELVERYGERVSPIELDFHQAETFEAASDIATDVDFIVNCAGILRASGAIDSQATEAIREELEVNVLGLIRLANSFAPVLKSNGGGVLVQLNSIASVKCFSGFATYSASKAAAYSITQGMREQLVAQGTRVISVHPGPIATDMAEAAGFADQAESASVVSDAILMALETNDFHVFPDRAAKQLWSAYAGFAELAIEPLFPVG